MTYIIDSNIPLLDAHNIYTIGGMVDTVVIPEVVLDELDAKKSGLGELAYQAREFGRLMTAAEYVSQVTKGNATFINYKLKDKSVVVIALSKYPSYEGMEKNVINDRKIIECALAYKGVVHSDEKVVFMTNDIACGIRAQSLGLETTQLREVEDKQVAFTKSVTVDDDEAFRAMHGKQIERYDVDYIVGNFNYLFENVSTGQVKLATVKRGIINVLGKESELELRKQEVVPRNSGQLFLSRAIQDNTIPLVIVEAPAGSGKTLVALSNAIKLIKTNSPYKSIMYIRASVDDVEDVEAVGFLKGSADDKNAMYFYPALDALGHIAKQRIGTKLRGKKLEERLKQTVDKIVEDCDIQMFTGLGMRGRTFEDAVVILDEAQNMSKASMRKVLTRFGKNCKIIVGGSNKQIDNPYVTKYTNGLSVLLDAATSEQQIDIHVVSLDKVVRSEFAEFAENIFEGK